MESIIARIVATVLTVILLAGVGYAAYNGYENNKVSTFSSNLATVQQAINTVYANSTSFSGLATIELANLPQAQSMAGPGVANTATLGTSGTLIDSWGNQLTLVGAGDAGAPTGLLPNQFAVLDTGATLTPGECQDIAGALANSTVSMTVAGLVLAQPITVASIAGACDSGGSAGLTMTFIFSH